MRIVFTLLSRRDNFAFCLFTNVHLLGINGFIIIYLAKWDRNNLKDKMG